MNEIELDAKVKAAQVELQAGAEDARGDGVDVDSCWNELVSATAWQIQDDEVAREFCRRELGLVPFDLEARLGRKDWLEGE